MVTLRFNVQPGDVFRFRSTFTSSASGSPKSTSVESGEQIVALVGDKVHLRLLDDPDYITVYDARGYPVDILQGGASVRADLPDDMFDISNRLIFPDRPVSPGDTWEANDGAVHVSYRLMGINAIGGREVAEVHATESSYHGPLKFWIELATGKPLRQEYMVGAPPRGTSTLIERI